MFDWNWRQICHPLEVMLSLLFMLLLLLLLLTYIIDLGLLRKGRARKPTQCVLHSFNH